MGASNQAPSKGGQQPMAYQPQYGGAPSKGAQQPQGYQPTWQSGFRGQNTDQFQPNYGAAMNSAVSAYNQAPQSSGLTYSDPNAQKPAGWGTPQYQPTTPPNWDAIVAGANPNAEYQAQAGTAMQTNGYGGYANNPQQRSEGMYGGQQLPVGNAPPTVNPQGQTNPNYAALAQHMAELNARVNGVGRLEPMAPRPNPGPSPMQVVGGMAGAIPQPGNEDQRRTVDQWLGRSPAAPAGGGFDAAGNWTGSSGRNAGQPIVMSAAEANQRKLASRAQAQQTQGNINQRIAEAEAAGAPPRPVPEFSPPNAADRAAQAAWDRQYLR